VRLAQLGREREQHEADRDVQPEDPLPGDAVDDRTADERAHGDGESRNARPDAERGSATLARDGVAQNRQRERRDDRRAEALQRAGGDQPVGRRRQRGGRGRGGEDANPEHEHALPPEAVAERGPGQ
jgi:hypothetical protein